MNPPLLVLYAEDDENDAFFMLRAFAKMKRPATLRVVRNGRQAIEYLEGGGTFSNRQEHPLPALLLLDVKMPEVSGMEVLKWVRARPGFARMPVTMFTSSTQESDVAFSRAHGANAYLVKPSNAQHLALLMEDLLSAAEACTPEARLRVPGNYVAEK
jgi:CheY-like chemotaxis protein